MRLNAVSDLEEGVLMGIFNVKIYLFHLAAVMITRQSIHDRSLFIFDMKIDGMLARQGYNTKTGAK